MPKANKENKHRGSDNNHANKRGYFSYAGDQYIVRVDGEVHGNNLLTKSHLATQRLEDITCYTYNTPYRQLPQ